MLLSVAVLASVIVFISAHTEALPVPSMSFLTYRVLAVSSDTVIEALEVSINDVPDAPDMVAVPVVSSLSCTMLGIYANPTF